MCFSAEASFTVGTALLPAGTYCVAAAIRKRPRFLPLAVVPLLFGVQQIAEGFVWLGLHRDDPALIRTASLFFLFFALAFWPFYFPFMSAWMEPHLPRRRIFAAMALLAFAWFWLLYVPIVADPESVLTTRVVHHSIQYDYGGLAIYQYVPRSLLRILYFLCVAVPMAFGSESLGRTAGITFAASAVFAVLIYDYAFVSVWCFFAAALSLYLCWLFARLKSGESIAPMHSSHVSA